MSYTPASRPISLALSPAARIGKAEAASCLFGLLAAPFLVWSIWRLGFPMELDRNEAWNAWFVDAALNGRPLYPSSGELIVNNYPPLSFYMTALVAKLIGDTIIAGRLLSIFALLAVAAATGSCIRDLGGSRRAAAFGALWLLATMSHAFTHYIGMNDPSLLGFAIMCLGLALFLHRLKAGRAIEPAIAIMVLAGFVKHTLFALPLAALIWLGLSNRPAAVRAAGFGGALCTAGLLCCTATFGPNFATQMLMPREISFEHALANINKLQWIAPALLCWLFWACSKRMAQFTALLLGLTLFSGLVLTGGAGVVHNAYFEAFFASAAAVALAFQGIGGTALAKHLGVGRLETAVIAVLLLRLAISQNLEPYYLFFSSDFRLGIMQRVEVTNAEIERIRDMPGPVSCSIMTVCYRAGKSFVFDRFWVEEKLATGTATREEVSDAIAKAGIRFELIPRQVSW